MGDPLFRDTPLDKIHERPDSLLTPVEAGTPATSSVGWPICYAKDLRVCRALVRSSEVRTAWSAKNPSLAVDHWQYGRQISIFYSFLRPWRHKSKSLERLGLIIWALFTNANIRAVTRKVLLALKSQRANIYDSQESSSTQVFPGSPLPLSPFYILVSVLWSMLYLLELDRTFRLIWVIYMFCSLFSILLVMLTASCVTFDNYSLHLLHVLGLGLGTRLEDLALTIPKLECHLLQTTSLLTRRAQVWARIIPDSLCF